MKVLEIDIETTPNLGFVWDLWNQNIGLSQLVESTQMLCFAAKWLGGRRTEFYSNWGDGHPEMVRQAWRLLDEADVVEHYNGRRFDVPHLRREFVELDMMPPSPFKQIDLYEVVKRQFRFPSNKLNYVAKVLGLGSKVEHEGFSLWVKCMDGDATAQRHMREYNIQDVVLLESLHNRLLPWIPGLPSYGAFTGADVCPACGSDELVRQGYAFTKTGRYQRYQCECGRWLRATRREAGTGITEVTA